MNKLVNGKLVPLTAEELAQREIDSIASQAQQLKQSILDEISTYKTYLSNTDWYYTRKLETGIEVPSDIITNRVLARENINRLEA